LSKDLEKFKSFLSEDLEKLKSELTLLNKRQEITFSRLHEKRATLIAEVYAILADIDRGLTSERLYLKRHLKDESPTQKDLTVDLDRLKEFLRLNRLYFPDELVKCLSSVEQGVGEYDFVWDAVWKMGD